MTLIERPDQSDAAGDEAPHRVARNVSALASGQAVTWATALAVAVVVPRALGPTSFGKLVTAFSVTGLFGLLLGFVTVTYLVREMVAKPSEAPAVAGAALHLRLAMIPLFMAGIVVYAHLLGVGGDRLLILYLVALGAAVNLLTEPIQAAFQAIERMEYVALTGVIGQSSMGIVGIALVLLGFGAVAIAASSFLVAILALSLNIRWARRLTPIDRRVNGLRIRRLARGSLPFVAVGMALLVYTWIDAVILSIMAPSEVVGWYGVSTKLFTTLMFVPSILGTAWFPRFVSAFEDDPERMWDVARPNTELVLVLSIAVAAATALGAAPVMHLIYGSAYDSAVPVMIVLAACIPPMYLGIAFGQVLMAAKRASLLTGFIVAGAVLNSALNIVLIPRFQSAFGNGALASALSMLVTELLITTAGFAVVGRYLLKRSSYARAARCAVACAGMVVVGLLLRPFGIVALVPAGITFVALALVLGVASAEERQAILSAFQRVRGRIGRMVASARADGFHVSRRRREEDTECAS